MRLSFEEMAYLSLYLELFNRCYDPRDERKYEVGPGILVRHTEMQNMVYLLELLRISFQYGFSWNWRGPYSPGLQALLNELDQKEIKIEVFYDLYNQKRDVFCNTYEDQLNSTLSEYYTKGQIEKIANASLALEDILKEEEGSEWLVRIAYLAKTVIPGANLSEVINELNYLGYSIDSILAETIWKDLAIIGVKEKDTKRFTRERKLINNQDGRIN